MKKENTTLSVIYCSPTRTSQKVAHAIAEGLDINRRIEIDLTYDTQEIPITVENGIAIIAVPVYAGRVAPFALKRIQRLKGNSVRTILVAVYGNRDYEDALLELKNTLSSQGFVPYAGAAFIGEHSYSRKEMPIAANRPDALDLEKAKNFGQSLVSVLTQRSSPSFSLEVSGHYPYRDVSPSKIEAPVCTDDCHGCGICINLCPTEAIQLSNEGHIETNAKKCIKCCACVKGCPNEARIFETPYTEKLHRLCSERKEPTFFLGKAVHF
jgi:ferredoxin